jgi:hypothetical protein
MMHEMMDYQLWKQRREEMLREVERNRLVRALRATRRRRTFRISALAWEMKRQAGCLFKFLRKVFETYRLGAQGVYT